MVVSDQLHAPVALFPDKHSWYQFNGRPDGHQSRFGLLGEEKELWTLPGIESRSFFCPARSHFTNGIENFVPKTEVAAYMYFTFITFFHILQVLIFINVYIWGYSCLTLRRLMSYIYGAPILDVSRSHTTTQHSR